VADEWIPFVLALDLIAVVYLLSRHVARKVEWRWPPLTPRPYICSDCARLFARDRVLAWHRQAEHNEEVGPLYWKLPARNRDITRRSRWRAMIPQLKLVR
jgi:hypothetical protein